MIYSLNSFGQTEESTEYQLRATFFYNFVNFAAWPKINKHDTFNMYFLNGNPFDPYFDYITQVRKIKDLQGSTLSKPDSNSLSKHHLLYISHTTTNNKFKRTLTNVSNKPVLTIVDNAGACQKGTVINMEVVDAGRITFEANSAFARTAKLVFSSQLLRFAKEVYQ